MLSRPAVALPLSAPCCCHCHQQAISVADPTTHLRCSALTTTSLDRFGNIAVNVAISSSLGPRAVPPVRPAISLTHSPTAAPAARAVPAARVAVAAAIGLAVACDPVCTVFGGVTGVVCVLVAPACAPMFRLVVMLFPVLGRPAPEAVAPAPANKLAKVARPAAASLAALLI